MTLQNEATADVARLLKDKARLDWLEQQIVEVWTPLPAGAQQNFMALQGDLRSKVDAALLKATPEQSDV